MVLGTDLFRMCVHFNLLIKKFELTFLVMINFGTFLFGLGDG